MAAHELHVRRPGSGNVALGEGQHLVGHVEADGAPGGPHPLRGQEHVDPAARAKVEHALALVELGHGDRVAATERGKDRRLGQLRPLERGIERRADRLGLTGTATAGVGLDRGRGVARADLLVDGLTGTHRAPLRGRARLVSGVGPGWWHAALRPVY